MYRQFAPFYSIIPLYVCISLFNHTSVGCFESVLANLRLNEFCTGEKRTTKNSFFIQNKNKISTMNYLQKHKEENQNSQD